MAIVAAPVGLITSLGIGKESTPGTAVSATLTGPAAEVSVDVTPTHLRGIDLTVGTGGVPNVAPVQTMRRVTGRTKHSAMYSKLTMLLLEALCGTLAEGGGGGPTYTHTFTLSAQASLPSYTLVQQRGNSGYKQVMNGCKAASGRISCPADGPAEIEVNWIGQDQETIASASAPSVTTGTRVLGSHGALTWNSVTYTGRVTDATVEVNNNIAAGAVHGQATAGFIEATGDREVAVSVTLVLTGAQHDALRDAHLALTESNLVLTYTSGSEVLAITLHNASVETLTSPVNAAGVIRTSVRFVGRADGSNGGLAIVATNAVSTYDA